MSNTKSETLRDKLFRRVPGADGWYYIPNMTTEMPEASIHKDAVDMVMREIEAYIQERVKEAKRQTMIRELGWASRNGIEGVRRRIADITKEEGKV